LPIQPEWHGPLLLPLFSFTLLPLFSFGFQSPLFRPFYCQNFRILHSITSISTTWISISSPQHFSFFCYIPAVGNRLKYAGLLAEAAPLANDQPGVSSVPAPGLPDFSDSYCCGEILSAVSRFPYHDRDDLTVADVASLDEILVWMRAVLNYEYGNCIRKIQTNLKIPEPSQSFPQFTPITGRLLGQFGDLPAPRLTRESFLTSGCLFTLTRQKVLLNQPRILADVEAVADVSVVTFDFRIPMSIAIDGMGLHLQSQHVTTTFNCSDITEFVRLNERTLHLVVQRQVLALTFQPERLSTFLAECHAVRFTRARLICLENTVMPSSVEAAVKDWCTRRITSFKFLVRLNVLGGRTFADPSIYPVFPPPGGKSNWTDESEPSLDGTFIGRGIRPINKIDFRNRMFALPEWYFFPEICGSVQEVYKNRKELEQRNDIGDWIWTVFGQSHSRAGYRHLFFTPIGIRARFTPLKCIVAELKSVLDSEIIFCIVVNSLTDHVDFVCVSKSGTFSGLGLLR
jgi:hypothetical protein